jgi:hypothetical protein
LAGSGDVGAGFAECETRVDLADFVLAGLLAFAWDPADIALRVAGLATRTTFRAAAVLRDAAFLAAGFPVFEAFLAGISFSAPG